MWQSELPENWSISILRYDWKICAFHPVIDCTPLKVIEKGSTRFQSMTSGEYASVLSTATPTMSKFVIIIEAKNQS